MKINLEDLVKEFGIDKLPEQQRNVVMGRLLEAVHIRVGLRMAEVLSAEDAQRFEELSKKDEREAFEELEKMYPDFRKVYQEEVDRLRQEMRALKPSDEEVKQRMEELRGN